MAFVVALNVFIPVNVFVPLNVELPAVNVDVVNKPDTFVVASCVVPAIVVVGDE